MRKSLFKGLLLAGIAILALFGACDSMFFNIAEGGGESGEYTVTFDTINAGTISPIKVEAGGTIAVSPIPPNPPSDFTFMGWHRSLNFNDPFIFEDETGTPSAVNRNITLYALWHFDTSGDGTLTITFDANTGSPDPDNQTPYRGQSITMPPGPATPPSSGVGFIHWNINPSGGDTAYNAGARVRVLENMELFAIWGVPVTVTFHPGSGASMTDPIFNDGLTISVGQGGSLPEPDQPEYANHRFMGWYTEAGFNNRYTFGSPINENINLYARWEQEFTITFHPNGGTITSPNPVKLISNENLDAPSIEDKTHHTFDEWFEDPSLLSVFNNFGNPVFGDLNLYAKWNPVPLTIIFNENGGTLAVTLNLTGDPDDTINFPDASDLTPPGGKSFGGWNLNDDSTGTPFNPGTGDNIKFGDIVPPTATDVIVYAHWND